MYNAMSTYNKSSGVIGTDVILFAVKGQGSVAAVVRDVDSLRVFRQLATGRTNMTDALGFGSKFTLFCTPWPEAIQLASGSGQTSGLLKPFCLRPLLFKCVSACLFTTIVDQPARGWHQKVPDQYCTRRPATADVAWTANDVYKQLPWGYIWC